MIIQGVRIARPQRSAHEAEFSQRSQRLEGASSSAESAVSEYMLNVREGVHDRNIANFLGIASSWSYSDIDTFARLMHRRGIATYNETVGLTNTNPALFVDTTAYLVQSASRKIAILTFRGTGLQNTVNWLTDVSARPDTFLSAGRVHGGFYRAALLLWPTIRSLLQSALNGDSICEAAMQERAKVQDCRGAPHACGEAGQPGAPGGEGPEALRGVGPRSSQEERSGLDALYITGHSLGGALAVVAAALIHIDPELDAIRRKVRGIYTYGQPMVGFSDFAARFDEEFGKKLFRHVYGKDIVPCLPPRTTGPFVHFGREFQSDEGGWVYRSTSASQVRTFLGSTVVGVLAWVQTQLSGLPLLQWLPTRYSWGDHSPLNYLRTSQTVPAGSEFA
ncbi:lipase family protein [Sorangium sp. So ce887]|uniref:lipase family protein n=1 Tax=Sorangium sp. So ce887 TaxID=3133324 RepID=UPI003F5D81B5